MDFEKVLVKRVSARKYTSQMPSDEDIQKVIDAALLAPIVHWHKLHLLVVTNSETLALVENMAASYFDISDLPVNMPKPYMYGAPVWIVLSGKDYDTSTAHGLLMHNNLFWNVGSIIENMELQATALGLASCGINTTVIALQEMSEVRKVLGIPEGYNALASVILGYAAVEVPERPVKPELIPVSYVK